MIVRRHLLLMSLVVLGTRLSFAQVRVIQTNSGSENIHIIDPSTNAIVGEVKGVPINHGAAASRDGSRCSLAVRRSAHSIWWIRRHWLSRKRFL